MSSCVAEVSSKYLADVAKNGVPVGYKQTEVGLIPEDWQIVTLNNLSEKIMVGIASAATHAYRDRGVPFLRNQNILPNRLDDSDILFITPEYEQTFQNKRLKSGDLLTARTGYPGTTCIVPEQYCGAQSFTTLITRLKLGSALPNYVSAYMNSELGQKFFELNQIGGGQKNVNSAILKTLPLPLPKLEEQTAIANALSDVDALISELEKLIAKKQAIKTATMQQLLTGRTRLPQFALREDGTPKGTKPSELGEIPEDWEVAKIGDFAPLQRGFDLPSSSRVDGKYPVVYSNGIVNTHCHFQVKGPGVVTGRSGTLGKVHYVEDDYWPHNTSLWVTKFNGTEPKFIYFVFTYIGFERFASGSGVPTLNRNDAHSYKLVIPTTEAEQTAIATILADMDEELQALEQRLSKTRQIKQGMMQELLTGKTRLIKPSKEVIHE
ncbi:restriction endonuclease subunit S [Pseudoalteromonas xiamenensis]|uniref:restriction endonuclease subunit S n=1 Tax=Pseudoalteromonas xiamenensis TaxID=882626 RepID=UPI0035F094D6